MSAGGPVLHVLREWCIGEPMWNRVGSTGAVVDEVIGGGEAGGWAMTEEAVVYWLHRLAREGVVERIPAGSGLDYWALDGDR